MEAVALPGPAAAVAAGVAGEKPAPSGASEAVGDAEGAGLPAEVCTESSRRKAGPYSKPTERSAEYRWVESWGRVHRARAASGVDPPLPAWLAAGACSVGKAASVAAMRAMEPCTCCTDAALAETGGLTISKAPDEGWTSISNWRAGTASLSGIVKGAFKLTPSNARWWLLVVAVVVVVLPPLAPMLGPGEVSRINPAAEASSRKAAPGSSAFPDTCVKERVFACV
eukprot:1157087-Pelagomonas_calceolata.AAC.18